ncbi:sugar phosphate isomerase/epimerase family protein [Rothia halotolerans]|uniref:sugar phosphate isomerase/epimerase family protein n=1 Tax=Rothia halotolerans TaxID=405770 RepID=UPI00101C4DE6|nr:sugar phosphate isomerase/epimerase [Rothia halotolerans]
MHIGVLTDSLADLTLDEALAHARAVGAETVEFGAGPWSPTPHVSAPDLLASQSARADLKRRVEGEGLGISAINASGNPLHPGEPGNDGVTRDAIRLAGELGVETVVLMSGLPAGREGDLMPNWITTSWPPETTQMLEHQWNDVALPYWADLAEFARRAGVSRLAVEMHGNQLVYNVPSALRLREEIGETVGVNFDPSHLLWMGADPLRAIPALGSAIQHVHAKDTRVEEAAQVRSRLEYLTLDHPAERAWNFVTVGRGADGERFWADFVQALRGVGYDGALSIEHEDVEVGGPDGVAEAAGVLSRALAVTPA